MYKDRNVAETESKEQGLHIMMTGLSFVKPILHKQKP